MVEILITMLILTIALVGLAALQVTSIQQVTQSGRNAEAVRLAESILTRYKSMSTANLAGELTTGWEVELGPSGTQQLKDVGADGDPTGSGPYTVERLIEQHNNRYLVTIRVSWVTSQVGGDNQEMRQVELTTERY
jgi:Tfp pilus assembly protein PilV